MARPFTLLYACALAAAVASTHAQQAPAAAPGPGQQPRPEDTEVWTPVPVVVTPGGVVTTPPPSDAIVLFDGTHLDEWVNSRDRSPAGWTVATGIVTVHKPSGHIQTRRTFRNYQLHLEYLIPAHITGEGQNRGNSGVFLAATDTADGGYELQVLDSFNNRTYVNGQGGSVYKQFPPLSNASRKPGEWQSYDVVWTAPTWSADGRLASPAFLTVFHNGVLIQDHVQLRGETLYRGAPFYRRYDRAPLKLQAHNDPSPPISFRNIWLRERP